MRFMWTCVPPNYMLPGQLRIGSGAVKCGYPPKTSSHLHLFFSLCALKVQRPKQNLRSNPSIPLISSTSANKGVGQTRPTWNHFHVSRFNQATVISVGFITGLWYVNMCEFSCSCTLFVVDVIVPI